MKRRASLWAVALATVVLVGFLIVGESISISAIGPNNEMSERNLPITQIIRLTAVHIGTFVLPTPTRRVIIIKTLIHIPTGIIVQITLNPTLPPPTFTPTKVRPTFTPTTATTITATFAPPTFTPPAVSRPTQANAAGGTQSSQACLTDKALAYVRNSASPARTDIVLRLLASGSETIPTANLPGVSQHPRWSDDGCTLYFAYRKPGAGEKYHIWMLKGAQTSQVSSSAGDDIWLMKNAQATQLTASPAGDEVDPDSAGGSKVVFVGDNGHLELVDTLSPQNITDMGVEGHQPSVSPDGNWIIFLDAKGQLSAISIRSGKQVSLGRPAQNPGWDPSGSGGYFAAVQPDGSLALDQFTFSANPPDLNVNPIDPASLDLAIDPDGAGQAVLVSGPLGKEQLQLVPSISPLGQKTPITQASTTAGDPATTNYAPDLFSPTRATADMQAANAYFTSAAQNQGGQ